MIDMAIFPNATVPPPPIFDDASMSSTLAYGFGDPWSQMGLDPDIFDGVIDPFTGRDLGAGEPGNYENLPGRVPSMGDNVGTGGGIGEAASAPTPTSSPPPATSGETPVPARSDFIRRPINPAPFPRFHEHDASAGSYVQAVHGWARGSQPARQSLGSGGIAAATRMGIAR